jgi:hypothetical protein
VSLGWHDLRRTVRRRGSDAPAQAYPYLLKDERLYPQLALAIDYFESMVGRPRAELDGEVLVQFFADHRLARAVVASLAGHYRYRRQSFADALDAPTCARLAEQGLQGPVDLRAALYADVNRHDGGFAADTARTAALARLAERTGLAPDAVEALLVLDAEDRAPLVRLGAPPAPADVAAIYNYLVAEAVLRSAARVDLELAPPGHGHPGLADGFVSSLAGHAALAGLRPETIAAPDGSGVHQDASRAPRASRGRRGSPAPPELTLFGEQDALGSWTRHGRRLVRALARALVRHPTAVRGGAALVQARGGPYTCSLSPEFLRAFMGPSAATANPASASLSAEAHWDPRPELVVLRRRGAADGWSLRNWPAPLVYPEGVLFPDFALVRGAVTVHVVVVDTPAVAETIARLAPRLAARGDVLLARLSGSTGMVTAPGVATVDLPPLPPLPMREGGRTRPSEPPAPAFPSEGGRGAGGVRGLPAPPAPAPPAPPFPRREGGLGGLGHPLATVLAASSAFEPHSAPTLAPLDRVLVAVSEAGFLPTERALTLAGCADEGELAGRLAAAGVEDVRLVPGVGLHTEAFLRRLHGDRAASGAA